MTTALAPIAHPYEGLDKVPDKAALLPTFSGRDMAGALTAYRELQHALDQAMPDQIIDIRGKLFRKKGYWRAIRTAFNLSVECVREESTDYGWRVIYRASAPTGRFADGDGACENDEKAEGQDTEHNVRSHAHTRAFNRAVSNLVGFGEVSAEEVQRGGRRPVEGMLVEAPATGNRPPATAGYHYIHGYQKNGEWHEFHLLNYRQDGGSFKFSTKRDAIGDLVRAAFQDGLPIQVTDHTPKKNSLAEGYVNKLVVAKPPPSDAELDAELLRQEQARQAGEVL